MATYKGINGFAVQSLASDPSPLDEGQVWYNNTTYAFKLAAITTNSWATATSLPTVRNNGFSFGTRSAAVIGGGDPSYTTSLNYNGTSWTSSGSIPVGRASTGGGLGTQTSGLIAGGYTGSPGNPPTGTNVSLTYNGSSFSNGPNIGTPSWACGNFGGSQTAGTYVAGYNGAGAGVQGVENYNGTSWTSTGNMNESRGYTQCAGTQTAGIVFFGYRWGTFGQPAPTGAQNLTETFNGSTWTTAPNTPTTSYNGGSASNGSQTASLGWGGTGGNSTTYSYNGSSWATTGNLLTPLAGGPGGGSGTKSSAMAAGGGTPVADISTVQQYNDSIVSTKTITTS